LGASGTGDGPRKRRRGHRFAVLAAAAAGFALGIGFSLLLHSPSVRVSLLAPARVTPRAPAPSSSLPDLFEPLADEALPLVEPPSAEPIDPAAFEDEVAIATPVAEPAAAPVEAPVQTQTPAPVAAETAPPAPVYTTAVRGPAPSIGAIVEDELRPGDSLSSSLERHGVSAKTVDLIERELRPYFDFRRARPGHRFRLVGDADGSLVSFHYRVSDKERYWLESDGDGFRAWRADASVVRRRARLAGTVSTTLFDAVHDLGESPQLASDFAAIFAWDVDFAKAVRPGDEFRILYERNYSPRGEGGIEKYLGPGRILAARYKGAGREVSAVYYETEPGHGAYYRTDGSSVKQAFLAAPLNFNRITSAFTHARLHPILGIWRPHPGIDYAAPLGTPIWSVANGRVTFAGWAGGYGRLVKIEHTGGYESYYAHMSRFADGLRVGSVVRQKQVIGFVGATGLATGPHVCFRVTKDGNYVDPSRVRMPGGDAIPVRQRQEFETVRDHLLAGLGPAPIAATDEAM
jgi:murein DD-endopeptidase MepM/ murein hydrolase activator NlpD